MNPYSDILNNPLAGVDPTGYEAACDGNTGTTCAKQETAKDIQAKDVKRIHIDKATGKVVVVKKDGSTVEVGQFVKRGISAGATVIWGSRDVISGGAWKGVFKPDNTDASQTVSQGQRSQQDVNGTVSSKELAMQLVDQITDRSQVDNMVKINKDMIKKGDVQIHETKNKVEMTINAKVFDKDTGQGEKFVETVNKYWTTTVTAHGKIFSIRTKLTLTNNENEASIVLKYCICKAQILSDRKIVYELGRARRGRHEIQLFTLARRTTYLHEFGHIMGLGHQLDKTNSIMSYSRKATIIDNDVIRLVQGYYYYVKAQDN